MSGNGQVTGFGIHLKVSSIEESRAFYEGYLGLKPVFAYGDEQFRSTIPSGVDTVPEKYRGVTYDVKGTKFEIADGHIAVSDAGVFKENLRSPKLTGMINVNSLVPFLNHPSVSDFPIRYYYWQTIEMVVRDPDGWILILIAPYSDYEFKEVSKHRPVETVSPGGDIHTEAVN
jgi:catechol 2,3-dioxygenase-like lactoylglutathione lyase family enzyme